MLFRRSILATLATLPLIAWADWPDRPITMVVPAAAGGTTDIAARALHIHGSLGVSNEMPFVGQVIGAFVTGIADGPTEVHKVTVARQHLRAYRDVQDPMFPAYSIPQLRAAAIESWGDPMEAVVELADQAEAA